VVSFSYLCVAVSAVKDMFHVLLHLQGDLVDCYLIMHYDTGPSSDFVAKILGVGAPLCLCTTQFYFSMLPSYVVSLIKGLCVKLPAVVRLPVVRLTQV
jgi:hypothetical protein